MAWYDLFANFYDRSLEALFADAREAAAAALLADEGMTVLDLPCGTGQSLPAIHGRVGERGRIFAVDLSQGMLARARARASAKGWTNVHCIERDVHALTAADLEAAAGEAVRVDRLHCFLGMSVFPNMDAAFERLFGLLAPGGRVVVLDTYAEHPSLQGRLVNLMAGAEIRRRFWEPIEARCEDFERREIPSSPKHGGALILCTGRKR